MIDDVVIAGLCVVGALSVLTFLFCLSFARRLRQMAMDARFVSSAPTLLPMLGTEVGAFDAVALDGATISVDDFAGSSTAVIFVSTTCQACERLSKQLLSQPLGEPTIVFVSGSDAEDRARVPAFASAFEAGASHVVWTGDDESVRLAFGVEAFPTLLRVSGGLITDAAFEMKAFAPKSGRARVAAHSLA